MLNVFVAYDLMHPGQNYGAVEAAVSGLGSAVKLLNTTWYVRTGLSLDQVRAHVGPCALFGHRFTVGELEGRRRQLLCQGLRYVSRRGHTKRPAQRPAIVLGEDA